MTTEPTDLCLQVAGDVASVVDGTAPPALYEHIADCDACRDLRHDAARAAELVAVAGADFRPPAGFVDRLIAGLEPHAEGAATMDASPAAASIASVPAPRSRSEANDALANAPTALAPLSADAAQATNAEAPAPSHDERSASPASPASAAQRAAEDEARLLPGMSDPTPAGVAADTAPPERSRRKTGSEPRTGAKVSPFRKPRFYAALVSSMAAAAAIGLALRPHAPKPVDVTAPWAGQVASVVSASADKTPGGLEACDEKGACAPVGPGTTVRAGMTLRTDARTRAFVTLADGSTLALDRATKLELDAHATRTAKLLDGTIVADVAHLDGAPAAHVDSPLGDVEIVGTRLAVTAAGDHGSVEVARGTVRIATPHGPVEVRAGEEASLTRGEDPVVASATSLADTLAWSDHTEDEVDAPVLRGLGELRARKPGSTVEKDHAVHLAKHAVKIRVVDVVARTEVDETFTNDTDEELEGVFRFPLPPGAQIERLALEVDGKLVDGAFVDRDRGAAIWRGVIHNAAPKAPRPRDEIVWVPGPWRDPALLEWQRGGRFELKIFPIPKHGSRRVVLAYTQVVEPSAGVRRFTYPLAHDASGTTRIDSFDVDLQVLGADPKFGVTTRGYDLEPASADGAAAVRKTFHASSFVPAGDLTVEYALPDRDREITAWAYQPPATPAAPPTQAAKKPSGSAADKDAAEAADAIANDTSPFVAIALRPKLPRLAQAKARVHAVVVDASRSMVGERFGRATHLASAIVREMDRRDTFVLLACDTVCRAMPGADRGPIAPGAAAAEQVERFLGGLEPDGGSDLAAAVSAARAAVGPLDGRELRIEYLGDGTPTVGPTRPGHLEAAVRAALPDADGAVVAVALGADADTTSLAALARGGGGVVVPYVPGQRVGTAAIDVLGAAYGLVLRDVEVELPSGLTQVTPAALDPIRAGGEAFVFARMSGDHVRGTVRLRGRVAGERFEETYPVDIASSTSAGNAFVPRLFAAAKIDELERVGGEAQKPTIVALSKRFAVASRFTSLLVLESEAMFRAFGVDHVERAPDFTGEVEAQSSSASSEKGAAVADAKTDDFETELNAIDSAKAEEAIGGGAAAGFAGPAATSAPPADTPATRGRSATGTTVARPAPAPPPPAGHAARPSPKKIAGGDVLNPFENRDRGAVPMRRIFERKASFDATNTLARDGASKLLVAEAALRDAPDDRKSTVDLYALYATSGRLGEAQELTAKWSSRDALDPEALVARADLAARQGDRDRAVRILGGLVDVRPTDRVAQTRLADLEDAAGDAQRACEHRIALADLAPGDAKLVADAVRCARAVGQADLASALVRDASDAARPRIESLVSAPVPASTLRGDVQVSAEWSGGADLDVALVDAKGRRVSWLGAPSGTIRTSARDVTSTQRETLGLAGLPSGSYVLEVTRASQAGDPAPIRGEITLRLVDETRKIPFVLSGDRAEIGTVRVFFRSRLVPLEGWGVF